MARLPTVGGDNGNWGQILNDYLSVEHNPDGSLKVRSEGLPASIADGSISASKLSGPVNSYLASAQTAVQSVNGKNGQAVTLAAADISDVMADSEKGAANGVATLDGSSKLTSTQLPDLVVSKSTDSADTGKAIDAYTGAPLVVGGADQLPGVEVDETYNQMPRFTTGLRIASQSGGAVTLTPSSDNTSFWDLRHGGSGYWLHAAHLTDSSGVPAPGVGTGTLAAFGVQGDGGNGILVAKDGPDGVGIWIDQKGVVTDAAAPGFRIDQSSRFAPGSYWQSLRPDADTVLRVLSTGHTPVSGEELQQWFSSYLRSAIAGRVFTDDGSLRWHRRLLADGATLGSTNQHDAMIGYLSTRARVEIHAWHGMGRPGGASSDGPALKLSATAGGSQKQFYSGAVRMSSAGQALRLEVNSGISHYGYENLQTVLDLTASRAAVTGTDLKLEALTTPSNPTLSTVGTAGTTTYGYKIAYTNSKGTTVASSGATIATGNATLSTTNRVRLTLPALPPGVTGVKVYGRTAGSELLMDTVTLPTRTVADGVMKAAATRSTADGVGTANSTTITSATAGFTSDDIGSTVQLVGAGYNGNTLDTHITAYTNSTTVTVATAASRTVANGQLTVSRVESKLLTSATAAFTSADVGKRVTVAGAGASAATLYSHVVNYLSPTQVVLHDDPSTSVTAATITVDGGSIPTTWDDDGSLTPSGALPTSPTGHKLQLRPWENQTGNLLEALNYAGTAQWGVGSAGLPRWIAASNEQTTVGSAGAASALPATPTKYLKVVDSTGATLIIPAYAVS